ncbi:DNA-binding response regulator [Marinomonas sp. 42_23_T18]|nr:DNA-binding response regulator [Marinomonas sp. 42_23_T18]
MRILVIEDDLHISNFLKQGFEQLSYQVAVCDDGYLGYQLAKDEQFDLVILDLMLPTWGGEKVLQHLRGEGHDIPIIILSAKHTVEERVKGLESGADDYLIKPFAFAELAARCQVLLNRQKKSQANNLLEYQGIQLDLLSRKCYRDSLEITLKQREFALMHLFLQQPERVFSKTVILESIWGYQFDPQTNVVDVLVCRLRAQLDKGFETSLIHTIRGVGYVLKAN